MPNMSDAKVLGPLKYLKGIEDLSLVADNITFIKFVPRESFEFADGVLTVKAESRLKEINGLVGLAGAYFAPKLLSASNCAEVVEAWNWLRERIGDNFEQLSFWLTSHFIIKLIWRHQCDLELLAPMTLAVRFHRLSENVDTGIKLRELRTSLKGNLKHWLGRDPSRMFQQADHIIRQISNLDSEIDFAILAGTSDHKVELSKTPDMYVDGIGVDVKTLSWDPSLPTESYVRKVIERSRKAFGQNAKLASLSIGVALTLLGLERHDESGHSMDFRSILDKGLGFAGENKKPVLMFHHSPWTDDIAAQVETLSELKQTLALRRSVRILTAARRIPSARVEFREGHMKSVFKIK